MAQGGVTAFLPSLSTVCATLSPPNDCINDKGISGQGLVDYHLKTPFKAHSGLMYRISVEGYSYDQAKSIHSEAIGYLCGDPTGCEDPRPIDAKIVNGNGLGALSPGSPYDGLIQEQYISSGDNYLVLRMTAGHYCTSMVLTANLHYSSTGSKDIGGTSVYIARANSTERL
jgi:hypothetical protein